MIRFWYVVPRLVLLLALCLFVNVGLDPLLRYGIKAAGESATGAKVNVGSCEAFPFHLSASLRDVQVANPQDSMRDLFGFEQARLQLNSRALADRRFVIDRGMITGLQFDVDRAASGQLETIEKQPDSESEGGFVASLSRRASDEATQWWTNLQDRLEGDFEQEFQSIPLARRLATEWQVEYDRARDDVQRWEGILRSLRVAAETIRDEPLQSLQQLPTHLEELARLRDEVQQATGKLAQLRQQLQVDARAVDAAKEHDLQHLRELTRFDGMDAQAVTDYLLGEELVRRTKQWSGLLGRAKMVADYVAKPPKWNRQGSRGIDVLLAPTKQPSVLVRMIWLSGQGRSGSGEFLFAGQATNLTNQPRRHGRPAVFDLSFRGSLQGQMRAVIDRRSDTVKQRFTVNCPRVVHQQYMLGDDARWALRVEPGTASCWIDVELDGDKISGDLRWREDQLTLKTLAAGRKSAIAARAIQGVLDRIERLHVQATLSGSAADPELQLRSNLGPDLSHGVKLAARRELAGVQERLALRLEQEVDEQLSRIADRLSTEQSELLAITQSHEELFAGLRQLGRQLNVPQEILGVRLPLSKLFGGQLTSAP